jgi:hypothetical protein
LGSFREEKKKSTRTSENLRASLAGASFHSPAMTVCWKGDSVYTTSRRRTGTLPMVGCVPCKCFRARAWGVRGQRGVRLGGSHTAAARAGNGMASRARPGVRLEAFLPRRSGAPDARPAPVRAAGRSPGRKAAPQGHARKTSGGGRHSRRVAVAVARRGRLVRVESAHTPSLPDSTALLSNRHSCVRRPGCWAVEGMERGLAAGRASGASPSAALDRRPRKGATPLSAPGRGSSRRHPAGPVPGSGLLRSAQRTSA